MRRAVLSRCELNFGAALLWQWIWPTGHWRTVLLIREHLALSALPFLALGTLTWTGSSDVPSATTTARSLWPERST